MAGKRASMNGGETDGKGSVDPTLFSVFVSEAKTFHSVAAFKKAIRSYSKALELKPGDRKCLVSRGECYLHVGVPGKALSDANTVLREDKKHVKGLLVKAEAYYQLTQFEYALVFFHRGHKLRPEIQRFRLGIQKAQEAIENSIGDGSDVRLQSSGDLSLFYEEQEQVSQKSDDRSHTVKSTPSSSSTSVEQNKVEESALSTNNKTCKQLLGELYADRIYLEKLLHEASAETPSGRNVIIQDLAKQELDHLNARIEFWDQHKPPYSRNGQPQLRRESSSRAFNESLSRARNESSRVSSAGGQNAKVNSREQSPSQVDQVTETGENPPSALGQQEVSDVTQPQDTHETDNNKEKEEKEEKKEEEEEEVSVEVTEQSGETDATH